MKNLTKLQIFMLMTLAVGSAQIYTNMNAVQMFDRVENSEDLDDEVLNELEKTEDGRAVINQIIIDESDLEAHFDKIRHFIRKLNKQITELMGQSEVAESEVARLAVELADAKNKLEEAQARRIAKGKNKTKIEDQVNAELNKAVMALKNVNQNVAKTFSQAASRVKKQAQKAISNRKTSKATKAVGNATAQGKKMVVQAEEPTSNDGELAINYVESQLYPRTMEAQVRPLFVGNSRPSYMYKPFFSEEAVMVEPALEEDEIILV